MNISSMLADAPVASKEHQQHQHQEHQSTPSKPQRDSEVTNQLKVSHSALIDDDNDETGTTDLTNSGNDKYIEAVQQNLGAIAQLDQYYTKASNYDVLETERKILDKTIQETQPISDNYVERIVTEDIAVDIPKSSQRTRPRSFNWGSSRIVKSKTAEDDALLNAVTSVAEQKAPSKRGGNRRSATVKKNDEVTSNGNASSNGPKNNRSRAKRKTDDASESTVTDSKRRKAEVDEEDLEDIDKPKAATVKEQRAVSKQYDNVFLAIWKDMARKDGPKVSRLLQQSTQATLINMKKTSILASREAKRWQLKNNKNQKDLITKARRAMREMFNFWKRNERIERELRKKHEKDLLDKAKKEEEDREAKRQARKLNFLITQTELYSHFIGKKIKTDEIEGEDTDPNLQMGNTNKFDDVEPTKEGGEATDFNSLDFDNDDDAKLHAAAAANAQTALQAAQDKAKSFDDDKNGDEMNFQNPTLMGDVNISQPELLKCTLKEYQLKGLNWLANLYEQGINGILADEMGLGKTVQSISVLSYLAEHHNIWGPFLVVTPASTLHNWQQEISKFVPDFKVLPYWGSAKDRKILRKFWDRKNLRYGKDSPFHVLVTSYQLVVADAAYFQKMKWQYMILDEAQAIKSSQSSRWKSLLSFSCRNRLLLTGTPIQNSMQELWALLHFIMPSLFDSHDEFSDWFSKDIESHAQSNTQLNEAQLRRLHMILKPFMLRRIKKNVQSELGDKVEIDLFCDLTQRQKKYYQMLKSQISVIDLLESSKSSNDQDSQSLINLVMQFRKVCNHPDLFERADVRSPFVFGSFAETGSFMREGNDLECSYTCRNEIIYNLPKLVFDEILQPNFENDIGSKNKLYTNMFNIYHPDNVQDNETFGFLKFVDTCPQELHQLSKQNVFERAIDLKTYSDINYERHSRYRYLYGDESMTPTTKLLLINEFENIHPEIQNSQHLKELYSVKRSVFTDMMINVLAPAAEPLVSAPPIEVECSKKSFMINWENSLFDTKLRGSLAPMPLDQEYKLLTENVPVTQFPKTNLAPEPLNHLIDYSNIRMPSMNRFITESGKLAALDKLLVDLKKNDHRVLVYFQMTKMMDLMEEYLTYRQHSYIRLDGSSKLDDRRDLVHDWQSKPEIFVFLLSTRAGGLGINLTAADTVIFYDSDWNPTIDSQAMDRAHRLGQTRQVTVYRLLTRNTIEERMRNRAKQKEQVQQVVMEGKAAPSIMKEKTSGSKDVAFLLMGDDDTEEPSVVEEANEKKVNGLEEMYHEGEGKFSSNVSGTVTPAL